MKKTYIRPDLKTISLIKPLMQVVISNQTSPGKEEGEGGEPAPGGSEQGGNPWDF